MARLLCTQLMIGVITQSLLQITSADLRVVYPGENVTLFCNITNSSDILWYRLQSADVKVLATAKKGKLQNHFSTSSNMDESHFDVSEDSSLVIIGVRDTDLGVYYCGEQNTIRFGKPIRMSFTDDTRQAVASPALNQHQIITTILTCVCSISFLINIICICVFRYRVQEKSISSLTCFHDTNIMYSHEKCIMKDRKKVPQCQEMNLNYASLTFKTESTDRSPSDLERIIYSGMTPSSLT